MKILGMLLLSIATLLPLVGLVGCETESSDKIRITVSPNTTTLARGASQEFTASGWTDYTWSLSDPNAGVLSTKKGDRTVYTAVASPASNTTQVLTVSATIGSTSSNGASDLVTAEALIRHL